MTSPKIGVLLIEDQAIFRRGGRLILEDTPDIEVVGEAADGAAGLDLFDQLGAASIQVVITDLSLPDISGLEVMRQIKARRSGSAVIFLPCTPVMSISEA